MPVFKIDGNGSTTNTLTGKTFRYRKNEPVHVSEADLPGLRHMRARMVEVRPAIMYAPEPVLDPAGLQEITHKRKAGRPRKA